MKRSLVVLGSMLFAATAVFGQSNVFMDKLLETDSVTAGQAAYLVLVATDQLAESADEARAFDALAELGWVPEGASADAPMPVKDFSYILMKALDLRGGFMYALFPGPRYAYRQLVSSLVIQGRSDPGMHIAGTAALMMLGRALDLKGGSE